MTEQERALITASVREWAVPPSLTFTAGPGGTVRLAASPCPLLADDGRCGVYEQRPYVCRRFVCGRADVTTEAYEPEVYAPDLGLTGCANLSDRVRESPRFRAHVETIQRRALPWARAHGWRSA